MTCGPDLALGTVQFGATYGIAGRGEPVPPREAREILARAWDAGVCVLDTAPVYGDIEERLLDLAGDRAFRFVTKIPALTHETDDSAVARRVRESISKSRQRLGERLESVLYHRGADLLGRFGEPAWEAAAHAISGTDIRLGVSCYSPQDAYAIKERFPISIAQLPGNALDQRIAQASNSLADVEIHLRSAFLQGLLLMPLQQAVARLPNAGMALTEWHRTCASHGLAPLQAALGIAKSFPGVRYCIVGVDRLAQLDEIVRSWRDAKPLVLREMANDDLGIIDPRNWVVA